MEVAEERAAGRGRHRRPEPLCVVHLVLAGGDEVTLRTDAGLARTMSQVAALLAHW